MNWNRFLPLVGVFALVGCKDTPEKAFEEIQEHACDADVGATLTRIDLDQVKANGKRKALASVKGDANLLVVNMASKLADQGMNDAVADFRDNISKGETSNLCRSKFESAAGDSVIWITPSGNRKLGRFAKYNGKWIMVEIGSP